MSLKHCVVYTRPDGGVSTVHSHDIGEAVRAVPPGVPYEVLEIIPENFPLDGTVNEQGTPNFDRTFRTAWKAAGRKCEVDVPKAKEICHEKRRAVRAAEFAPLDVEATIPAKAAQAEAARQAVRDKHAAIQAQIDAAKTVAELKTVLEQL